MRGYGNCPFTASFTAGTGQTSLFQCQLSAQENRQVFTPNIPDFYFNHTNEISSGVNLTRLSVGNLHVLSLPPLSTQRDCNGSIVAFEYCYSARQRHFGNRISIFHFLSLKKEGYQITVEDRFTVRSTPKRSICSKFSALPGLVCCDKTVLSEDDELNLPNSNYTFGVVVRNRQLLAFSDTASQYHVPQFQLTVGTSSPPRGTQFNLTEENDQSIPLLRFIIGKMLQHSCYPFVQS